MASLTLEQLVGLTKFPDDFKNEAYAKIPSLTKDQRFQLEQVCWEHLTTILQARVQARKEEMFEKLANGEIQEPASINEIEQEVLGEFLAQIESVKTSEQIADVKEELAKHINKSPEQSTQ